MTVRSTRRRRNTRRAALLAACGLAIAAGAGAVGGVAIYHTSDGEVRGPAATVDRFPSTETALVGVVDEAGSLGSLVVVALPPLSSTGDGDGRAGDEAGESAATVGGHVVVVPVTADAGGGHGPELQPLDETYRKLGLDAMVDEVQHLLGVSIDAAAVLTADELAATLDPLGRVELELPHTVRDRGGRTLAVAGPRVLPASRVAAVLASVADGETAAARYDTDIAVWRALAGLVGPGLDEPLVLDIALDDPDDPDVRGAPGASSVPTESVPTESGAAASMPAPTTEPAETEPASHDPVSTTPDGSEVTAGPVTDRVVGAGSVTERLARLTAGPVAVVRVTVEPLADLGRNPHGIPAVALDHAEVVTLFAHLTPDRMAAPNPGLNLRIVSTFAGGESRDGVGRYNVAYAATAALLGMEHNVISVDTSPGTASELTVVEIVDETLFGAATALEEVLGPIEVELAERRIAGVDAVVTLGTDAVPALGVAPHDASSLGTQMSDPQQ